MKILTLLVLLNLCCLDAFCQKMIEGTVKTRDGKPLSANVLIQAKGSSTISGFTSTNKEGEYSLSYKIDSDSIVVSVTGINIGKHQKIVSTNQNIINFIIEEKSIKLKEVNVLPSKIQRVGDTLNYSVSSYMNQNDRVIGDVLKKMPGIEVSSMGSISYNGRKINKFYIENLDMLQGRYGIATNNISAKDVSTVQVLENHQPIKALQKTTHSNDAAINIKLKESAKGTLALAALVGGGYKPLGWEAELTSMHFAKGKQNMSVYKGNNTGHNLISEFTSHYDGERLLLSSGSMLSVQEPNTPPIPQKRYFDNNAHAVSINHLSKITDSLELVMNIFYYNDYIKKEGYSLSEQFIAEDSILRIEENMSSKNKLHNIEASIKLNSNKSNYYFNNFLNLKGSFNDLQGQGISKSNSGLDEAIYQKLDNPYWGIDNTLNLVKNINTNTFKIHWSTAYIDKPHNLTVTPANYWGTEELNSLKQNLRSKRLASNLRASYGIRYKDFIADYTVWTRIDLQNLDSDLRGRNTANNVILSADSLNNDLGYNNYQVGITQSYSYKKGKIYASLDFPLYYYILTVDDNIIDINKKYNKLIINPYLSFNYKINHEFNTTVKGYFTRSFGDLNSSYTGYIMHNYRSFLRNTIDDLFESRAGGANIVLNYSNAFEALFINLGGNYRRSWNNLLYGYNYQGIMSIKSSIDQSTNSATNGLNLSISKGLDFWSTTLRFNTSYTNNKAEQLIQNKILDYRSEIYRIGGSVNATPVSFGGIQYGYSWEQSQNYIVDHASSFPKIRNIGHNVQINLFLIEGLTINAKLEHQYNSAASTRHTTFVDAGAKYKYKQIESELEFNNILNSKQYVSTIYNGVNTYFYSYDLRPANILLKVRFKLK